MKNKLITIKNDLIRTVSEDIKDIDQEITELAHEMNIIREKHNGIGLAGIQIGVPKRIITIDLTKNIDDAIIKPLQITIINPVIIGHSERKECDLEGCLSVPGEQGEVERYFWIEIEGRTLNGEIYKRRLYDLAARVVQHEIDHLNGVLFVDKLKK